MTEGRIVTTREQAHMAALDAYQAARMLILDGKRVLISAAEVQDDLSMRQRRFLHGPVLGQISEQVRMPDGTRYVMAIWKEHCRSLFLGDRWEVITVPGRFTKTGKPFTKRRKVRVSTEDLGLKAYSQYIDQVIANAVTEWGVEFRFLVGEREAATYTAPVRKHKAVYEQQVVAA